MPTDYAALIARLDEWLKGAEQDPEMARLTLQPLKLLRDARTALQELRQGRGAHECEDCGARFDKEDWSTLTVCGPCFCIRRAEARAERAEAALATRPHRRHYEA